MKIFTLLRISPTSSAYAVRRAYLKEIKRVHPDVPITGSHTKFIELQQEWEWFKSSVVEGAFDVEPVLPQPEPEPTTNTYKGSGLVIKLSNDSYMVDFLLRGDYRVGLFGNTHMMAVFYRVVGSQSGRACKGDLEESCEYCDARPSYIVQHVEESLVISYVNRSYFYTFPTHRALLKAYSFKRFDRLTTLCNSADEVLKYQGVGELLVRIKYDCQPNGIRMWSRGIWARSPIKNRNKNFEVIPTGEQISFFRSCP